MQTNKLNFVARFSWQGRRGTTNERSRSTNASRVQSEIVCRTDGRRPCVSGIYTSRQARTAATCRMLIVLVLRPSSFVQYPVSNAQCLQTGRKQWQPWCMMFVIFCVTLRNRCVQIFGPGVTSGHLVGGLMVEWMSWWRWIHSAWQCRVGRVG